MGKAPKPHEIADPNELLDIARAAAFLKVSEASLRRWTNSGRLACLRVGRRRERRFRRTDLLGFMERQPSKIAARFAGLADAGLESSLGMGADKVPDLSAMAVSLTHGGHLCGLYDSDLGRLTLAVHFLLDGLAEGSVCFLVGPPRARAEIVMNLKKRWPSVQADVDEGRLVLSAYHLGPHAQNRYFRTVLDNKIADGARSFRIIGDLWGMRSKATGESLIEYEAEYDRIIARRYPVVTLCIYDARKFSGVEVLNALKGHRDTFRYPLERALA